MRSSHSGAMRGGPFSSSGTVSEKSPLPAPNVRLPLPLTNTLDHDVPWNGNWNVVSGTSTDPSSVTGSSVPV
ncbi:MAG: hypothetical protein ACHQRO_14960 [Vicinamibacteria bacterium]